MENLRVTILEGVIVSCSNYLEGDEPIGTLPAPEYLEDNPWDVGWLWEGNRDTTPTPPKDLYVTQRKREYDQLNQWEMHFDDQRDGTTTWVDSINEIKAKFPKG
jgi:hypothetical protein